jgi:hypothetical protein
VFAPSINIDFSKLAPEEQETPEAIKKDAPKRAQAAGRKATGKPTKAE